MGKQAGRRAATTEAILKAGRRLFGEQGFAATTMDDIAEAARVAKGAVYHHFATKETVFEAVVDQGSRDLVLGSGRSGRTERDGPAGKVPRPQPHFAAGAREGTAHTTP